MKIIAINGSPRREGNSTQMLRQWVEGVQSVAPDTEVKWVRLYDLSYTGCRSCFACKRIGGKYYGTCPIQDDIRDLIEEVYAADAVAIASPIYFAELSAQTRALLERLLFSRTSYRKHHDSLATRPVPITMIYSMNCPEEMAAELGYPNHWEKIEWYIANAFLHPVRRVCAYDTYQFSDYSKYEMEMFDETAKRAHRETHFPLDLSHAHEVGAEVATELQAAGLSCKGKVV